MEYGTTDSVIARGTNPQPDLHQSQAGKKKSPNRDLNLSLEATLFHFPLSCLRTRVSTPSRARPSLASMPEAPEEHRDTHRDEPSPTRNPLCHPLDGLSLWTDLHPTRFNYCYLDDGLTFEKTRLDAETLSKHVAMTRDAILRLLDERSIQVSSWTSDVQNDSTSNDALNSHASDEEPKKKVVLLLCFPPGLEFLVAFLACHAAGVVAVPARPPDPTGSLARFQEERKAMLGIAHLSGARICLTTRSYSTAFALADGALQVSSFIKNTELEKKAPFAWVSMERLVGIHRDKKKGKGADIQVLRVPPNSSDSIAFVQCTSGSTGTPKGVVIGHKHLSSNCALIRERLKITPSDCNVSWLPHMHDMGLVGAYLVPLTIAGDFTLLKSYTNRANSQTIDTTPPTTTGIFYSPLSFARDPASWMRLASQYSATMTQGPDFAYRLCAMRFGNGSGQLVRSNTINNKTLNEPLDLSKLRSCLNASERVQPDTLELFANTFSGSFGWNQNSMRAGYGLAESTVYVCDGSLEVLQVEREALEVHGIVVARSELDCMTKQSERSSMRVSSCGAIEGVNISINKNSFDPDIRVVNPDTFREVSNACVGEIWVRSDSVAFGYLTSSGFTKGSTFEILLESAYPLSDCLPVQSTFLRTGDLGFIRCGQLFITGRLKDAFKVNGRSFSPEDIERVVMDFGSTYMNEGSLTQKKNEPLFRNAGVVAFAYEEEAENGNTPVNTHRTKLGLVAEVRDTYGVTMRPVQASTLIDQIRTLIAKTHGLLIQRSDIKLLKPNSVAEMRTGSGKKKRQKCKDLFLKHEFDAFQIAAVNVMNGMGDGMGKQSSTETVFPDGLDALTQLVRHKGVQYTRASMERNILAFVVKRFGGDKNKITPMTRLLDSGSLDSFAAVTLTSILEFELKVHLEPTLVLIDAPSTRLLVKELCRRVPGLLGSDASGDALDFLDLDASETYKDAKCTEGSTLLMSRVTSFVFCCVLVMALILAGFQLKTSVTAFGTTLKYYSVERSAHFRFFEWQRLVAPTQIATYGILVVLKYIASRVFRDTESNKRITDFVCVVLNVFITHGVVGLAIAAAHLLGHVFLEHVLENRLSNFFKTDIHTKRKLHTAVAWFLLLLELSTLNVLETKKYVAGALGVSIGRAARKSVTKHITKTSLHEIFKNGFLKNSTFTVWRAQKFTSLRLLDRTMDSLNMVVDDTAKNAVPSSENTLTKCAYGSFTDLVNFALHPATYQCGPLIPHAEWRRQKHDETKCPYNIDKRDALRHHLLALISALTKIVLWCLLVDVLFALGYAPVTTFFSAKNGIHKSFLDACSIPTFLQVLSFATVSWITSHVVFGLSWVLGSYLEGGVIREEGGEIRNIIPHDTPEFWTTASQSPSRFWRRFHASFFTFFYTRVFVPLGGGVRGILGSVVVSTLFHGFTRQWLLWGLVTAVALVTERTFSSFINSQNSFGKSVLHVATVCTFVAPAVFLNLDLLVVLKVVWWGLFTSLLWMTVEGESFKGKTVREKRVKRE